MIVHNAAIAVASKPHDPSFQIQAGMKLEVFSTFPEWSWFPCIDRFLLRGNGQLGKFVEFIDRCGLIYQPVSR
jgi:hypothetical protein